jgi:hypothetical protein
VAERPLASRTEAATGAGQLSQAADRRSGWLLLSARMLCVLERLHARQNG